MQSKSDKLAKFFKIQILFESKTLLINHVLPKAKQPQHSVCLIRQNRHYEKIS